MTDQTGDDTVLAVSSGVSPAGKPFVVLSHGGISIGQLTPAEVRKLGADLIEAGNTAMTDAAVFQWLHKEGLAIEPIAAALSQLREARTVVERMDWAALDGSARNRPT